MSMDFCVCVCFSFNKMQFSRKFFFFFFFFKIGFTPSSPIHLRRDISILIIAIINIYTTRANNI